MDTLTTHVHLVEVFGPTWQGEGPYAGRRCGFVRLGLCNLACDWCDTPYSWDRSRYDLSVEAPLTPITKVHEKMAAIRDVPVWVLSGGEPLVHHRALPTLLDNAHVWHVETNGTIAPPEWWLGHVLHTSVSPKVGTSDPAHRRLHADALDAWVDLATGGWAVFKFVATSMGDLDEIDGLVRVHGIDPGLVWIMPEGRTADAVIRRHRRIAQRVLDSGYNTTSRLHCLLYDDERGR